MTQAFPDIFIDGVAKGASIWPDWTEQDGYESDPELRQFIDANYVLVDNLTLKPGAKPVRFYIRRAQPEGAAQSATPSQ